jgi:hypothetical protein
MGDLNIQLATENSSTNPSTKNQHAVMKKGVTYEQVLNKNPVDWYSSGAAEH